MHSVHSCISSRLHRRSRIPCPLGRSEVGGSTPSGSPPVSSAYSHMMGLTPSTPRGHPTSGHSSAGHSSNGHNFVDHNFVGDAPVSTGFSADHGDFSASRSPPLRVSDPRRSMILFFLLPRTVSTTLSAKRTTKNKSWQILLKKYTNIGILGLAVVPKGSTTDACRFLRTGRCTTLILL